MIVVNFFSRETGQAYYQDPSTTKGQQATTGDLYAMPEKGKGKGSRRQIPTGDLYTMPEKKLKYRNQM